MGKQEFSLVGWYRRFFLSERTATIATCLALALIPAILFVGITNAMLELPDVYNQTLRLLLIATLLHSIRRHSLLLMQAATVGPLFSVLCAQAQYALGVLAGVDSEIFTIVGLQGFIFLAVEAMVLFLESLVCFDHFVVHVARRRGPTRLFINRAAIVFLLALLVALMIIAPTLNFVKTYIPPIFTLHLDEPFIFVPVMCAEVIMLIDSAELVGE